MEVDDTIPSVKVVSAHIERTSAHEYKCLHGDVEAYRVSTIGFGLKHAKDILLESAVSVDEPQTRIKGFPRPFSICDPRMGTADRRYVCGTCGNNMDKCIGCFGHIRLPLPVYHPVFLMECWMWLGIVCPWCFRTPLTAEALLDNQMPPMGSPLFGPRKLVKVARQCLSNGMCPYEDCGLAVPVFTVRARKLTIEMKWPKRNVPPTTISWAHQPFTPAEAHNILKNIDDDIVRLVGGNPQRSRPESTIITYFPVPPPLIRPIAHEFEGSANFVRDPLAAKLLEMIRVVSGIRKKIAAISSSVRRKRKLDDDEDDEEDEEEDVEDEDDDEEDDDDQDQDDDDPIVVKVQDRKANHFPVNGTLADLEYMDPWVAPPLPGLYDAKDIDDVVFLASDVTTRGPSNPVEMTLAFMEEYRYLQDLIGAYMTGDGRRAKGHRRREGGPNASIARRYHGKGGIMRKYMMGKRGGQNGRAVLSPDGYLRIEEVGVPASIATVLTLPEKVNRWNRDRLQAAVDRGEGVVGGAQCILRTDGTMMHLPNIARITTVAKSRSESVEYRSPYVEEGDIVMRHIIDGDPLVFNRQPTLHRLSKMVHRARVLPGNVLRIDSAIASPYNADFDGDEGNLHAVAWQYDLGLHQRSELELLMSVGSNLTMAQSNRPTPAMIQDYIVGAYLLGSRDTFLDQGEMSQLMMWITPTQTVLPEPAILKPTRLWTGKQILSLILPKDFNYSRVTHKASAHDLSDPFNGQFIVRRGEHLSGAPTKAVVGSSQGSMIHELIMDYPSDVVLDFFNSYRWIIQRFLWSRGVSLGWDDCCVDDKLRESLQLVLNKISGWAKQVTEMGRMQPREVRDVIETRVSSLMMGALDQAVKAVTAATATKPNNLRLLVDSGAKGSTINTAQIMGALCQVATDGERLRSDGYGRTTTFFCRDDSSAEKLGFVRRGYADGLRPEDIASNMVGSREGLVATSISTAKVGYVTRTLTKGMESTLVQYDKSTRMNSSGDIVSYVYGGDGYDSTKIRIVDVKHLQDAHVDHWLNAHETGCSMIDEYFMCVRDAHRAARMMRNSFMSPARQDILMPCHIHNQVERYRPRYETYMTEEQWWTTFGTWLGSLKKTCSPTLFFYLLWELRYKVVKDYSVKAFETLLENIERRLYTSVAAPGEAVGILAAQSIGEPVMQGTLNTFHFAGVGSMNGTLGMPRTEELMHCTQCISRPLTTFVWKGDVFDNGISMVGCKLGDIVDHATIVYSDVLHAAVPSRDRPWVALAQRLNMPKLITTKGWVMRVTLSPRKVFVRKLDYSAVLKVLMKHEEIAAVTFSPETHHEWVIRMAPASPTTTMCERLQTSIEKAHAGLRDGGVSADHVAHLAAELHARNTLSRLLKTLLIQGTASIREIGNIKKTKEMSAHQDAPCKEIVATAAGSCLYDLAAFPQVDWTRVVTNDVMDVYNRLGIDAAARVLFRELKKVLTPSGSGFDTRHISTLVHAMCRSGNVVRMDRHGINRSNISVYQAASFEEAIRQLTRASAAGLTNPASDISSCTITGGLGPVGTGFIEVLPYVSKNSALTISL